MDGLLLFEEFELDIMKADHMYETALDKFAIEAMQVNSLVNEGFYNESSDDTESMYAEAANKFLDALKTWFDDLIERIKKLVTDFVIEIKAKQTAKKMNIKLSDIKNILANDKQNYLQNKHIEITDTSKYYKAYTKYIEAAIVEAKKVFNKSYKNYDEFSIENDRANKKLEKLAKELNLDNHDVYALQVSISDAYKFTEKEIANQEAIAKAYRQKWIDAVEVAKKEAEKQDDTQKINKIKAFANKINSQCMEGLRKIVSNKNASAIFSYVTSAAGAVAGAKIGTKIGGDSIGAVVIGGLAGASVGGSAYLGAKNAVARDDLKKSLELRAKNAKIANRANELMNDKSFYKNKNVDTDKTTKTNMDNDNKSDQKN